jgi:predicted DNA-binding transcriptional regulator YafY
VLHELKRQKVRKFQRQSRAPETADSYGHASRLFALRMMLEAPGGTTIADMVDSLHVSRVTVWRYLKAIQNAGFRIKTEEPQGAPKRWRVERASVEERRPLEPIQFSRLAMVSLFLVEQALDWLRGTRFVKDLDGIFRQFKMALAKTDVRHLDRKFYDVGEGVLLYDRRYLRPQHVDDLVVALLYERRLKVRHATVDSGKKAFIVEPLTLFIYKKGLYLACIKKTRDAKGKLAEGGDIRRYRLDGFRSIEQHSTESFEYPTRYRPEQLFEGSWGVFEVKDKPIHTVRIHFFGWGVVRNVKSRYRHKTQAFKTLGRSAVEMTLRVAITDDLVTWIVGWGGSATVVHPPELAAKVRGVAAAILKRYPAPPAPSEGDRSASAGGSAREGTAGPQITGQ